LYITNYPMQYGLLTAYNWDIPFPPFFRTHQSIHCFFVKFVALMGGVWVVLIG